MKAVVAAFNQEKALVGDFSMITNLRMELFEALISLHHLQYQDKFAMFCFCDSKSISLQLIETALQRIEMWEFIYLFMETTELSGVRPIMLPPHPGGFIVS